MTLIMEFGYQILNFGLKFKFNKFVSCRLLETQSHVVKVMKEEMTCGDTSYDDYFSCSSLHIVVVVFTCDNCTYTKIDDFADIAKVE